MIGKTPWRRKWLPTPVFLPEKYHEQRSRVGYSPWELDMTEHTWQHYTYTAERYIQHTHTTAEHNIRGTHLLLHVKYASIKSKTVTLTFIAELFTTDKRWQ